MNIAEPILKLFRKPSVPRVEVGDVVRVHQKIKEGGKERIQVFEGIVIATHKKESLDATFTVRKIASGVGVEKTYLLHSPRITKIEFKRSSNVRRSKLYYLRNLTGKALKMKDKKVTKESWNEVLATADQTEATEADVAEAVEAAREQEQEAVAESQEMGAAENSVVAEEQAAGEDVVEAATNDEQPEPPAEEGASEEAAPTTEEQEANTEEKPE